jgi:hypothetical protein
MYADPPMPSSFVRASPLQALKLAAVTGALAFAFASFIGMLPGQELAGLLYLAFFPFVLAVVVGVEALLAGYRLVRTDDPAARLTARQTYTAIRAVELAVTVVAPGVFYSLVVRIGGDVAGPGAIGLLFVGIALGLPAYGAVVLRTLVEYYYHRQRTSSSKTAENGGTIVE